MAPPGGLQLRDFPVDRILDAAQEAALDRRQDVGRRDGKLAGVRVRRQEGQAQAALPALVTAAGDRQRHLVTNTGNTPSTCHCATGDRQTDTC